MIEKGANIAKKSKDSIVSSLVEGSDALHVGSTKQKLTKVVMDIQEKALSGVDETS